MYWTHTKKYKGKEFLGNYEFSKMKQKRVFKLKNAKSGVELKEYAAPVNAKKDGWKLNKV
jgi:hypothetical protein